MKSIIALAPRSPRPQLAQDYAGVFQFLFDLIALINAIIDLIENYLGLTDGGEA